VKPQASPHDRVRTPSQVGVQQLALSDAGEIDGRPFFQSSYETPTLPRPFQRGCSSKSLRGS